MSTFREGEVVYTHSAHYHRCNEGEKVVIKDKWNESKWVVTRENGDVQIIDEEHLYRKEEDSTMSYQVGQIVKIVADNSLHGYEHGQFVELLSNYHDKTNIWITKAVHPILTGSIGGSKWTVQIEDIQPIEEELAVSKEREFQVGDVVELISNTNGHGHRVGDLITLGKLWDENDKAGKGRGWCKMDEAGNLRSNIIFREIDMKWVGSGVGVKPNSSTEEVTYEPIAIGEWVVVTDERSSYFGQTFYVSHISSDQEVAHNWNDNPSNWAYNLKREGDDERIALRRKQFQKIDGKPAVDVVSLGRSQGSGWNCLDNDYCHRVDNIPNKFNGIVNRVLIEYEGKYYIRKFDDAYRKEWYKLAQKSIDGLSF